MFGKLIKLALAVTISAASVSLSGCKKESAPAATPSAPAAEAAPATGEPRVVKLTVTEAGYEPSPITLKKDEPVKLIVTRTTDATCATEVVMDEYKIDTKLPLNQPVEIAFTPNKTGELKYGCGMDKMISGVFKIE